MTFAIARMLPSFRRMLPDFYAQHILAPEMMLNLRETATVLGFALADNAMYTAAESLIYYEDFEDWSGSHPNEAPLGWTPSLTSADVRYSEPDGDGGIHMVSDATGHAITHNPSIALVTGDTYRSQITKKSGTNASYGLIANAAGASVVGVNETLRRHISVTNSIVVSRSGAATDFYGDDLYVYKHGELDGDYVGLTVNTDTFLGQPAPVADGVNDYGQMEHNRLETVLNPALGSIGCAIKISQANWESAALFTIWCMGVDANNVNRLHKSAANTLTFTQIKGGTAVSVDYTVVSADYGKWLIPVATWGTTISLHVKASTDTDTASAGTWTGSNLTAAFCRFASMNGAGFMPGSIAKIFLTNDEISQAEYDTYYNLVKTNEPNAA